MEVNLFACKDIPEGAIFSVRAGTVRRQAAASSNKPFRFPSKPMDSPLKVEVFRPVGTAYVVLRPGEDQYKVQFKSTEASPMSCEVHVKATDGAASPLSPQAEEPTDASVGAKEAKDYLEGNQVMQFVQALLQSLIKDKPADPYKYMARHFSNGYEPNEQRSPLPDTVSPTPARTQESAKLQEAPPAAQSPSPKVKTEEQPKPKPDSEAIRNLAKDTLTRASKDGKLSEVLAKKEQDKKQDKKHETAGVEDIRDLAKRTLTQASQDGNLEKALAKKQSEKQPAKAETKPQAKAQAKAQAKPNKAKVKQLRATAKDTLVKANKDGKLAEVLDKKKVTKAATGGAAAGK